MCERRAPNGDLGFEIRLVPAAELPDLIDWFSTSYYDNRADAEAHFADHWAGRGATFVAKCGQEMAGYVTLSLRAWSVDLPCIAQLVVFEPYRRRGLGNRLMALAEDYIAQRADKVVLWVPVLGTYGPAQRLYAKRGYIPDGRGVIRQDVSVIEGETLTVDEDLLLCLVKDLKRTSASRPERP
jgi:GNAT superfamily N-acetyltransferase